VLPGDRFIVHRQHRCPRHYLVGNHYRLLVLEGNDQRLVGPDIEPDLAPLAAESYGGGKYTVMQVVDGYRRHTHPHLFQKRRQQVSPATLRRYVTADELGGDGGRFQRTDPDGDGVVAFGIL